MNNNTNEPMPSYKELLGLSFVFALVVMALVAVVSFLVQYLPVKLSPQQCEVYTMYELMVASLHAFAAVFSISFIAFSLCKFIEGFNIKWPEWMKRKERKWHNSKWALVLANVYIYSMVGCFCFLTGYHILSKYFCW